MTVTVHMHGNLRRFMPDGADRGPRVLPDGATAEELLVGLGAEKDTWLVAVNGTAVERDQVLREGDIVDWFEPVAGG